MAFTQQPGQMQLYQPWIAPSSIPPTSNAGSGAVVIITPPAYVPSGDTGGGIPGFGYHLKLIVPAGSGAGTYAQAHGLTWTPTMCWVIPEIAEGTTPSLEWAFCPQDTNATVIAINVSGPGTYDVYYT